MLHKKKGIIDFIQIIRNLNVNDFEFNIVGKYDEDDPIYKSNKKVFAIFMDMLHMMKY